ncbi:MAG: enoyl-CoA hydratase/isomerase family protein [Chloroflexi bacterium]|nr:enoyl-CoA hydratase/isomerase family protein [Chloroflexota bacterium]
MEFSNILVERRDGVGWVTLNRPEKRNRLNTETCQQIIAALGALAQDDTTRAVVLTGAGEMFCAGADIGEFYGASLLEHRAHYEIRIDLIRALGTGKPTIAAVNGHAIGAGAALANWCDLAVASAAAKLSYPEINVGISMGLAAVDLVRIAGRKRANYLCFLCETLTADDAERFGLVNLVVPPSEVLATAGALAAKLAAKSPIALQLTREVIQRVADLGYRDALALARDVHVLSRSTEDCREGSAAFLAKRPPRWTGR